jgi:hypothetical protein
VERVYGQTRHLDKYSKTPSRTARMPPLIRHRPVLFKRHTFVAC